VYDWLLFLHVLTAFALVASIVVFSTAVLAGAGAGALQRTVSVGAILEGVGGVGTLVFGIWLALYVDGYELWDGWILAAIVIWALAAEAGRRWLDAFKDARAAATMHWVRTGLVVVLLADMIVKPGA